MAKLFEIGVPDGMSTLKLDSQGRCTVHYSVKNVSARPIDGRAILVALPQTNPPDPNHPIQKGWVKLEGKPETHFDTNGESAYTVNVAVPPRSPAGTYAFRLDVVSVLKPDEGDSSQALKFTVAEAPVAKRNWALIAIIAVLVLAVAGVGTWLALRPKTPAVVKNSVPDLTGKSVADATSALSAVNLRIGPTIGTVVGTAATSGLVVSQAPAAGAALPADGLVNVQVGAAMVSVPMIVGQSLVQAQQTLATSQLTIGQSTNQPNPNFAGGVVFQQTPAANTSVQSNSTVNVMVTPQTVMVPQLTGLLINQANARLQAAGLVLGTLTGDLTAQSVIGQSPRVSTSVPIGTKVNLEIPSSQRCPPPFGCFYSQRTARAMVAPNVRPTYK